MQISKKQTRRFDDFDYWSRLALRDPQRFEQERAELLKEYIDEMPVEQRSRLSRTQWKIDQVRSLAKNPIDAMNRVSKLMWDELIKLNEHQRKLVAAFESGDAGDKKAVKQTATIVPFRRTSKD